MADYPDYSISAVPGPITTLCTLPYRTVVINGTIPANAWGGFKYTIPNWDHVFYFTDIFATFGLYQRVPHTVDINGDKFYVGNSMYTAHVIFPSNHPLIAAYGDYVCAHIYNYNDAPQTCTVVFTFYRELE